MIDPTEPLKLTEPHCILRGNPVEERCNRINKKYSVEPFRNMQPGKYGPCYLKNLHHTRKSQVSATGHNKSKFGWCGQARREGGQGGHLAPGPVLLRGPILRLQVDIITLFFNLIGSLLAENCVSNMSYKAFSRLLDLRKRKNFIYRTIVTSQLTLNSNSQVFSHK